MEKTMPVNKNNFCLKNIKDFPVKEAIQAQEKLIDLYNKNGLLKWFKSKYCKQPLKESSFIDYLLNNWEELGKDIIIEYTGIEVYIDKSTHIKQLQNIIKFILKEYSDVTLYNKIDFKLVEHKANEIMRKA